jgi:tetratricopeptide (TPR) repeat protein
MMRYVRLVPVVGGIGLALFMPAMSQTVLVDGMMVDRMEQSKPSSPMPPPVDSFRGVWEHNFRENSTPLSSQERTMTSSGRVRSDDLPRTLRMAEFYFREGQLPQALAEYRRLMQMQPNRPVHVLRAALLSVMMEDYEAADKLFARLSGPGAIQPQYLTTWGGVLIRLGRFDEAAEKLAAALVEVPDFRLAKYKQLILAVAGERTVNEDYWRYRSVAELAEVAGWMVGDAASLTTLFGETVMARIVQSALGSAVSLDSLPVIQETLYEANSLLKDAAWESAYEKIVVAQELGVNRPFLDLERMRCLWESGEAEAALALLADLREQFGDHPELVQSYSYVLIKAGRYEDAIEALSAVEEELPGQWHIRMARGYAFAGAGRIDEAWPIIEQMAENFPEQFPEWMAIDAPYVEAIRQDPRFPELIEP